MRINEMVAGTRSDLAVKLYGDDLDVLKAKGAEIERVIKAIPGAADVAVEQPPAPAKKPTGKKPGGQPGHPPRMKVLVPAERVDEIVPYVPTRCAKCDEPLPAKAGPQDPEPTRHQVAELPPMAVVYFLIHPRRNLDALKRVAGELSGILCSDRWCVYDDWPGLRQLCWAHVKRNWEEQIERGGAAKRIPEVVRSELPAVKMRPWLITFRSPPPDYAKGIEYVGRNHRFVSALAGYHFEQAMS